MTGSGTLYAQNRARKKGPRAKKELRMISRQATKKLYDTFPQLCHQGVNGGLIGLAKKAYDLYILAVFMDIPEEVAKPTKM